MLKIITLWLLFGLTHSILAAFGVKTKLEKLTGLGARFYRLGYSLLATGIIAGIVYYTITGPVNYLFTPTLITQILSYLLIAVGALLIAVSISGYQPLEFFGIKAMTPQAERLITTGFNGLVRHPLYLANNVFMLGIFINLPTQLMLLNLALYFVYLLIGVYFEEKKLVEKFGDEYKQYQQKVKAFIPFII
jgi:protein-S-isoprenylcysteine O-methyltransferase Ste14